MWDQFRNLLREAREYIAGNTKLQLIAVVLFLAVIALLQFSVLARAEERLPWDVREVPVSLMAGDQLAPAIDGNNIIFKDLSNSPSGQIIVHDLGSGRETPLYSPGIQAGPVADSGSVAWQSADMKMCIGGTSGKGSRCFALPAAIQLSLSGALAVSNHNNSVIRLASFDTMRSRILDSASSSGRRFDPAISGKRVVWIKERGYAGQYYEPLVVSYDLASDNATYLTSTGGGSNGAGESLYQRRHPVLAGDRVFYQQRLNQAGRQWDIYEAVPGTPGQPLVQAGGDQINPSASGNLIVYQDNRNGKLDANGNWISNSDIYLFDLEKGIEMPVSQAPGDQINPVIKGNVIAWEDNRNGSWDIYAAVLTAHIDQPQLGLARDSVYWRSYSDYANNDLTVRYRVANSGAGPAESASMRRINITPPDVAVSGNLPDPITVIDPGGQALVEVRFHLPPGVKQFRTNVFLSCLDSAGRGMWFPSEPPTV